MIVFSSSFSRFRLNRLLLLLGSALASVAGILLQNSGVLPLDLVTLLFFSFVVFLLALYRPGWVFLLFIGTLPLETMNLAPAAFGGIMLRPYQWLAGILLAAVFLRFVLKRLPFRLFRPQWFDALPVLMALGAFGALVNAPVFAVSLKQALVVTSFVAVYFLGRIFFRTLFDVCQALPFFLVSSLVVFGYAVWQNIRFLAGAESFQVMVGRPNATFSEADWLGMFTLLALSLGSVLLARSWTLYFEKTRRHAALTQLFLSGVYLMLTSTVLILTVARSAWLGAIVLVATLVFGLLLPWRNGQMRTPFLRASVFVASVALTFFLAVLAVSVFHLSPFQFLNRIESTTSGLQKITVSCGEEAVLPEKIGTVDELAPFGCRHITLEIIEAEKNAGRFVQEVYRDDPNVVIRKEIYGTVWPLAREHPLFGIGWGSAAFFLGSDERGAGLNASNVFFEVWLGSGLAGLMAFVSLWGVIAWQALRQSLRAEGDDRLFALFLLSALMGVTVFNLFNSGILLGFFFIFLSVGVLVLEKKPEKKEPL